MNILTNTYVVLSFQNEIAAYNVIIEFSRAISRSIFAAARQIRCLMRDKIWYEPPSCSLLLVVMP